MKYLTLVVVLPLLGCATGDPQRDLLTEFAARIAVYQGVDEFIGEDVERARRIQEISGALIATLDGDTEATVVHLRSLAEQQIQWDTLSPIDQMNLRAAMDLAVAYLESHIQDGTIPENYRVTVRKVLTWFHGAASLFTQGEELAQEAA